MKLIDVVYEVLKDSAAPMGGEEIERVIRERRLFETKGKTLHASIGSALYTDMSKLGAGSRFVKCGKGRFALKGSAASKLQPELALSVGHSVPNSAPDLQADKVSQIRCGKKDDMKKRGDKGFVYILRDDHCKKCVKIGKTSGSLENRLRQLQTGNPWIREYVTLETSRYDDVERFLHNVIKLISKGKQVGTSEFYRFDPEDAKAILMEFKRLLPAEDFRLIENENAVSKARAGRRRNEKTGQTESVKPVRNASANSGRKMFFCTASGSDAKGVESTDGFVVLLGSRLAKIQPSMAKYAKSVYVRRVQLEKEGVIVAGILKRPEPFSSPSAAACFVSGRNADGLHDWRTADGTRLGQLKR